MEVGPTTGATFTIRLLEARFLASSGPGVELAFLLHIIGCVKLRRACRGS